MSGSRHSKNIPGAGQRSLLGAVILLAVVLIVGALTERHEPSTSAVALDASARPDRSPAARETRTTDRQPSTVPASMRAQPNAEAGRARTESSASREAALEAGASAPSRTADAFQPSFIEPQPKRPRSMFANVPGYVPPDDPESLSVVTGRREAPPIDMEVTGGARSPEALARLLLEALQVGDEHALHALRLTREEFSVILWPELPESRPITHITADDAWGMTNNQSSAAAGRAVSAYGSHKLELIRIESSDPIPYRNFTLRRQVVLVCMDRSTGDEVRLKFAPSFLERRGRIKVVTFRD